MLERRKHSGFIRWPKSWGNRILGGTATFQTKCDLLIGPCSCGHIHRETDPSFQELLEDYDIEIEIMKLVPKNGEVKIPKYWEPMSFNPGGRRCSHLMGPCMCGLTHTGHEKDIQDALHRHWTKINAIIDLPE